MATMQRLIFWVREFIEAESATDVQRAFRLRFKILAVVFENSGTPLFISYVDHSHAMYSSGNTDVRN
jgi:hypothetical protein